MGPWVHDWMIGYPYLWLFRRTRHLLLLDPTSGIIRLVLAEVWGALESQNDQFWSKMIGIAIWIHLEVYMFFFFCNSWMLDLSWFRGRKSQRSKWMTGVRKPPFKWFLDVVFWLGAREIPTFDTSSISDFWTQKPRGETLWKHSKSLSHDTLNGSLWVWWDIADGCQ